MDLLTCTILFIILLTLLKLPAIKNQLIIWRWMRALNLKLHAPQFAELYKNVDGFKLSKQARQYQDAPEYTYGEIEFIPFCALLSQVNISPDTIFYDLGCGTGKAVLACAMVFTVKKSCGIELFHELYQAAEQQKSHLSTISSYSENAKKINFINDSFLNINFCEANLIFINAAGFIGEIWDKLNTKLQEISNDVTVLSASKKLICKNFNLIKAENIEMSWGVVTVYIYNNTC